MPVNLPNPTPQWIYEGLDPQQFEPATGLVINRAPKQIQENIVEIKDAVEGLQNIIGSGQESMSVGSADHLTTPRKIELSGDVVALNPSVDFSGDLNLITSIPTLDCGSF